jgi:hypothetical protein
MSDPACPGSHDRQRLRFLQSHTPKDWELGVGHLDRTGHEAKEHRPFCSQQLPFPPRIGENNGMSTHASVVKRLHSTPSCNIVNSSTGQVRRFQSFIALDLTGFAPPVGTNVKDYLTDDYVQ